MATLPPTADPDDHRRIDPADWREVYIIGDVHGCRETLDRLLDILSPGPADLLVFVGDLVRKGPDSAGVLELVRASDNALSVRGNNEQKLLTGHTPPADLGPSDLALLEELPLVVTWEGAIVVHGGIAPGRSLAAHDTEELLTLRSLAPAGGYTRPYWFEERRSGPQVFFGHTVLAEPFATPWAVGLDTGAVYGGCLTAYAWRGQQFYSVEPPETYRERSSDTIVSPRPQQPAGD